MIFASDLNLGQLWKGRIAITRSVAHRSVHVHVVEGGFHFGSDPDWLKEPFLDTCCEVVKVTQIFTMVRYLSC